MEWSVLAFGVWLSRDLPRAWLHSPQDQWGWLALVLWLSPWVAHLVLHRPFSAHAFLLGAAIVVGLAGALVEFHFLGHAALALALGSFLPPSWRSLFWFLSAVAWMPLLGWWLHPFPSGLVLAARLLLALAGGIILWPVVKPRVAI